MLTNLLENASRHGRDEPVDVTCEREATSWSSRCSTEVRVSPDDNLGELTSKFVSVGGQRGTAGLGLWIVQQIVEAMGGRVDFSRARPAGGLVATFRAPIG